jgi:hypothetical protein
MMQRGHLIADDANCGMQAIGLVHLKLQAGVLV